MKAKKTVEWQKKEQSEYNENNALLSALDHSLAILKLIKTILIILAISVMKSLANII